MLSCIMGSLDGRDIAMVDILGDPLHSDMVNIVNMRIDKSMAELLTRLYLGQYEKHAIMDKWKKVLYVRLKKSLYGTLKAAPLVWENLSNNLMKNGGSS